MGRTRTVCLRRAFTLVELLVVIAVIVVVMGIMLPALSGAKAQAQRAICQGNQHKVWMGALLYAEHWEGVLPFDNWDGGSAAYWPGTSVLWAGWLYTGTLSTSATNQSVNLATLQTGALWPYVNSAKLYKCPTDVIPAGVYEPTHYISTYSVNGAVSQFNGAGSGAIPSKLTMFNSAAPYMMWEVDETQGGGFWNDGANYPYEGLTKRHGGGAYVTCLDASAAWVLQKDYVAETNRSPGRLWCNPRTSNGH